MEYLSFFKEELLSFFKGDITFFTVVSTFFTVVFVIIYVLVKIFKFISNLLKINSEIKDLSKTWQIIKEKFLFKGGVITFKNDSFARETIKYRFKDVISSLNTEIDLRIKDIDSNIANIENSSKKRKLTKDEELTLNNLKSSLDHLKGSKFDYAKMQSSLRDGLLYCKLKLDDDNDRNLLKKWELTLDSNGNIGNFFNVGPFIDVEHYFYFMILQHIKDTGLDLNESLGWKDPYANKKEQSVEKDYNRSNSKIKEILDLGSDIILKKNNRICELLEKNLSSNSTDLSQMFWSQFRDVIPVIDHGEDFVSYTNGIIENNKKLPNVNILVDNYGQEFLCDLVLGVYLVLFNVSEKVTYHVNKLPIFVSDVIEGDYDRIINQLEVLCKGNQKELDVIFKIKELKEQKQIIIKPNFFWNMPTSFSSLCESKDYQECYKDLQTIFKGGESEKELLIIKGDLNYRRTVGDIKVPSGRRINGYIKYITCPTLIIRSFKSNVVLLGKCNKENKFEFDSIRDYGGQDWKTEGKAGVIQFINKRQLIRRLMRQLFSRKKIG